MFRLDYNINHPWSWLFFHGIWLQIWLNYSLFVGEHEFQYFDIFRSFIAFSGKNRILGVAAKNQQVTNMKNTVYGLKRLLGRKFRDPHVQRELQTLPYNVVEDKNGNILIKVRTCFCYNFWTMFFSCLPKFQAIWI